ncbi:hypothetical protein BC629DRAFT_333119 [Irpex lacteus]|nr:hypothetical protein BC629DRAFT_333119 [Irpex lacteus]
MDRCPSEIHLKIFSLACTDGGRTGCALSLVSRHIRSTSFAARFRTVKLYGVPRMRRFLNTLMATPSPPLISHLLLCNDGDEERKNVEPEEDLLAGVDTVMDILSAVAPTLVSLTGSIVLGYNVRRRLASEPYDIPSSRMPHFPLLRDLSWRIGSRRWILGDDALILRDNTAARHPQLPSMRRIHLWETPIFPSHISDITAFTKAAPQMAQLRLSGASQFGELPRILSAALAARGISQLSMTEAELCIELPKGLERLIVQSALFENSGWCGTGSIVHASMEQGLLSVAQKHDKLDIAPPCNYTIDQAIEDWHDVIEGGDGCWRILPRLKDTDTLPVPPQKYTQRTKRHSVCSVLGGMRVGDTVYLVKHRTPPHWNRP